MALGKLLSLSEMQFFYLENRANIQPCLTVVDPTRQQDSGKIAAYANHCSREPTLSVHAVLVIPVLLPLLITAGNVESWF